MDDSWLFNKNKQRRLGPQLATRNYISTGFTAPNSKCPVCSAPVYYYESPHGGRVFFDDLGPPWPKHPCTSGDDVVREQVITTASGWRQDGWMYLFDVSINLREGSKDIYVLSGKYEGRQRQFMFRSESIVTAEMVRYRAHGQGKFALSILDFDPKLNEWCIWSGAAGIEINSSVFGFEPLLTTIIHRHKVINSEARKSIPGYQAPLAAKTQKETRRIVWEPLYDSVLMETINSCYDDSGWAVLDEVFSALKARYADLSMRTIAFTRLVETIREKKNLDISTRGIDEKVVYIRFKGG